MPFLREHRSKIVRIAERESKLESCIIARRIEAGAPRSESLSGAAQLMEAVLGRLAPGADHLRERLALVVPFAASSPAMVQVVVRAGTSAGLIAREREVAAALDAVLASAFPGMRIAPFEGLSDVSRELRNGHEIRPESQQVDEASFKSIGLQPVPRGIEASEDTEKKGVSVPRDLSRRPDLLALGHLMEREELAGATVMIEIERFERDAGLKRVLADTYRPLAEAISNQTATELAAKDGFGRALYAHLAWLNAGACQRVTAHVSSPEPLSPVLVDLICLALYGVPQAGPVPAGFTDLTRAWPDCSLAWLERLPALLATKQRLDNRARLHAGVASGLRLGTIDRMAPLHLADRARAQHLMILGQTGTGKSTFISSLVRQDMEAGEAVVVFDAHGDLAQDCLAQVPDDRRGDLVYVHPTDPDGRFTLNIFEPLSERTEVEHNRTANDLINLFKRVYPEPKEAYGPMFMSYARNAVFLLLDARGKDATILDLAKVFADDDFRRQLIKNCKRADVKQFWGDIAEDVSSYGDNANVDNVAPYVVAKLTQLSGNEVLAPIIGATTSSLDFRDILKRKRICIVNLALPEIGDEDAKILGGLLFARLSASLQAQAKTAPKERMAMRVYLDEMQTFADETLAQSMAQMRKFGLTYTLACQHFAQIDGGGWRPDIGRAVLGNAANLVLFRLGYFDAHMLAPYVAPQLAAQDLMRVPNFHAAARLLNADGQPVDPLVFATDPPRD